VSAAEGTIAPPRMLHCSSAAFGGLIGSLLNASKISPMQIIANAA
jgi:hypothetical protein